MNGHYAGLTKEEIQNLWDNCVFVLDTNVLLNLYRYPENAQKDMLKILNKIKKLIKINQI